MRSGWQPSVGASRSRRRCPTCASVFALRYLRRTPGWSIAQKWTKPQVSGVTCGFVICAPVGVLRQDIPDTSLKTSRTADGVPRVGRECP